MFKVKVNEKKLKSLETKLNKIVKGISSSATQNAVKKALENIQATAIRIAKVDSNKILVELVETGSGKIRGRCYTDPDTFSYAGFMEFGTGRYAEMPHIGTTKTFLESGYEYWYIPVDKVPTALHYPIIEIQGTLFYLAHGVKSKSFMRTSASQTREQNVEIVRKELQKFIKECCK